MELDPEKHGDEAQILPQHYKLAFNSDSPTVKIIRQESPYQDRVTFEVIDVIEALGYQDDAYLTTALVYLMRLRKKEQPVVDVKKAIWWLQRWLAAQEQNHG